MFSKLLIANRGEIACRIIATARRMGIATVAVYSEADADTPHTRLADEAVGIGPAAASQSYLNMERVLEVAAEVGADAIHPGYGFLSENAVFAQAVADAGIAFVGPSPFAIKAMGDKVESREWALKAGVNVIPGVAVENAAEAQAAAREIGFPIMVKAAAGGGGKGMRIVLEAGELEESYASCVREAESSFGDARMLVERYITAPRHIEIQLLADSHGGVVHLGERECSIQRRNQKIIEEAPSPFVTEEMRELMSGQAVALAKAVDYCSAGTVEFVADGERNFHFLEMNTRLQVEHPVSELISGLDLVEWMLRVADGERLGFSQEDIKFRGWAMESRIYAEDPYRGNVPSPGRLRKYRPPAGEGGCLESGEPAAAFLPNARFVQAGDALRLPAGSSGEEVVMRNDTGVAEGGTISPFYDPMIAKLCVWAPRREAAVAAMSEALDRFEIDGIAHNVPLLGAVMEKERFRRGALTTHFLEEEYPGGFVAPEPEEARARRLAAVVFAMEHVDRRRGGERVPLELVVSLGERVWRGCCEGGGEGVCLVSLDGEEAMRVEGVCGWHPGKGLFDGRVDGDALAVMVGREREGWRLAYRGARVSAVVRSPREAEHMALLPERAAAGAAASRHLLAPMPGVVVEVRVGAGDAVRAGDALAVVEAMKMQNVLHAERDGVVARVVCVAGQQVGVGDTLIEFE